MYPDRLFIKYPECGLVNQCISRNLRLLLSIGGSAGQSAGCTGKAACGFRFQLCSAATIGIKSAKPGSLA